MIRPLHIKNGHIWDGRDWKVRDLYTTDVVVEKPPLDALEVDLEGYTIFPGLINAHDHLELNHYPRTKFREVYNNAHEWGEDVNARLNESPFKELRAYPLWDRLFIGGLKNLLCGATTVAHHNPPHKELFRKDFPVRVLKKYGWAHSLHFSTDEEVVASYRSTPKDVPWFIHLAEGTDEVAAGEYKRLKALGCVGKNMVIVHGVGLTQEDIVDAAPKIRGLVWCPSTNAFLLAKTARIDLWIDSGGKFAFGSDSRLTADGDLMDESLPSKEVFDILEFSPVPIIEEPERPLTSHAAEIIGCQTVGFLQVNAKADWFILPTDLYTRSEIELVVKGGVPQIGDPEMMAKFPHIPTVRAILDGRPKAINVDLAKRIVKCQLKESGLEVDAPRRGRMFGII
jgi:cytosine/adenosine deaminase-related metal-dependent hydrolase